MTPTTFSTSKPLDELKKELRASFEKLELTSVEFPYGFQCHGERYAATELRVIWFTAPQGHDVEVRRWDGCRHSFAVIADELAATLGVQFKGGKAVGLPMRPPPFP